MEQTMEQEDRMKQDEVVCAAQGPRALCSASAAVTVPGSHLDPEHDVIGQRLWQGIHDRHAAGQSVAGIARDLELDRKTVRGCLRQVAWRPYRREVNAATKLDEHRAWLAQRAPQVHYSARILHQELIRQRGFTGSYETVKLAVRPLRAEASVAAVTQRRFETGPGEQAQVDWGQLTVRLGAERLKVHVLVMTLGYSRRAYAEGFLRERMPDLLAAHENAFAHFGGRCETLLYDRMRTVVIGSSVDDAGQRRPKLNTTFDAFARHWGFTPRLCQPYRAQTKGKVESGVKYLKRNFAPGRHFHDLDDFNAQLAAWQLEVADLRIRGTTHQRPIDRFAEEATALVPVAGQGSFLQAMVRERVVADDWLVSLDGNRYSVPFGLIGKTVQVVREGGTWVMRYRGRVVAEHPVLSGRARLSVHHEHGPGAAARNARQRFTDSGLPITVRGVDAGREVEVRDLAVYDRLFMSQPVEAA
jgi:transposase